MNVCIHFATASLLFGVSRCLLWVKTRILYLVPCAGDIK